MSWDANFVEFQISTKPEIFGPIRPANSMLGKNFSAGGGFSVNKLISLCTAWPKHATSLIRERGHIDVPGTLEICGHIDVPKYF